MPLWAFAPGRRQRYFVPSNRGRAMIAHIIATLRIGNRHNWPFLPAIMSCSVKIETPPLDTIHHKRRWIVRSPQLVPVIFIFHKSDAGVWDGPFAIQNRTTSMKLGGGPLTPTPPLLSAACTSANPPLPTYLPAHLRGFPPAAATALSLTRVPSGRLEGDGIYLLWQGCGWGGVAVVYAWRIAFVLET